MDTLRLLFDTQLLPERPFDLARPGWHAGSFAGVTWAEGNPEDGDLWKPDELLSTATAVRDEVAETLGLRADRGVARLDLTTTRSFADPHEGRAFLAGMAAMEFPRLEATRRGTPVHSVAWTGLHSRSIKCRVYDKGLERGGSPWEAVRLEDQRRFPNGSRPPLDVAADPTWQRERFLQRFKPMRKAVDGVRAATFPVIAQAIADEVRYGYRPAREGERLAGALVLLTGGAGEGYTRRTLYRRRAELREAGYAVVDDFMEPVEVDLADELDRALEEFGG